MPNEKPGRFDAIASEVFGEELDSSHDADSSEIAAAPRDPGVKELVDQIIDVAKKTSVFIQFSTPTIDPPPQEISYTGDSYTYVAKSRYGYTIDPGLTTEKFREVLELEPFAEFAARRCMENRQNPKIRPNQLFRQTGRTWKQVVEMLSRAWIDDVRVVLVGACSRQRAITVRSCVLEWAAILAEREAALAGLRRLRCEALHPAAVRDSMALKRRPGEWLHVDHSFYDTTVNSLTGRITTP